MNIDQPRCQHYADCDIVARNCNCDYFICPDCRGYEPIPTYNVVERKMVYCENVTDGKFLKLQAEVAHLRDKLHKKEDKKEDIPF